MARDLERLSSGELRYVFKVSWRPPPNFKSCLQITLSDGSQIIFSGGNQITWSGVRQIGSQLILSGGRGSSGRKIYLSGGRQISRQIMFTIPVGFRTKLSEGQTSQFLRLWCHAVVDRTPAC